MQLPGPVRAVVGLIATAADEAKHLPDRAIELPMLAVSSALQVSLRAQQRYARLTARGDDVLNRRQTTDGPPPWATFDAPLSSDELHATLDDPDPRQRARAASQLLDELLGGPGGAAATRDGDAAADKGTVRPAKKAPAKRATAKKAAPKVDERPAKKVNAPRHRKPSRFDTVDE